MVNPVNPVDPVHKIRYRSQYICFFFTNNYNLKEVGDFIAFLESKRKRLHRKKEDPLSKTIGICEGPTDLADKHNKYVYG
jgi:hypothetical protein